MKKLFILSGVPGSGKTTWAKRYAEAHSAVCVCSRDDVRLSVTNSLVPNFKKEPIVYQVWVQRIEDAIKSNKYETIIADATNLQKSNRKELYHIFRDIDIEFIHVIFDVPLERALERNRQRIEDFVPEHIVEDMYNKFDKTPSFDNYIILKED